MSSCLFLLPAHQENAVVLAGGREPLRAQELGGEDTAWHCCFRLKLRKEMRGKAVRKWIFVQPK